MKEDHRSIIDATFAAEKRNPEKIQACTGFEPFTSVTPLLYRSSALSIDLNNPTESRSLSLNPYHNIITPCSRCLLVPISPFSRFSFLSSSRGGPAGPLPRVPLSPLSVGNRWESPWSNLRSGSIFVSL